jgi:hypothetical protein
VAKKEETMNKSFKMGTTYMERTGVAAVSLGTSSAADDAAAGDPVHVDAPKEEMVHEQNEGTEEVMVCAPGTATSTAVTREAGAVVAEAVEEAAQAEAAQQHEQEKDKEAAALF